jgi:hypothetical protein
LPAYPGQGIGFVLHNRIRVSQPPGRFRRGNWVCFAEVLCMAYSPQPFAYKGLVPCIAPVQIGFVCTTGLLGPGRQAAGASRAGLSPIPNPQSKNWLCFAHLTEAECVRFCGTVWPTNPP